MFIKDLTTFPLTSQVMKKYFTNSLINCPGFLESHIKDNRLKYQWTYHNILESPLDVSGITKDENCKLIVDTAAVLLSCYFICSSNCQLIVENAVVSCYFICSSNHVLIVGMLVSWCHSIIPILHGSSNSPNETDRLVSL